MEALAIGRDVALDRDVARGRAAHPGASRRRSIGLGSTLKRSADPALWARVR
jgi:hypothetical protein